MGETRVVSGAETGTRRSGAGAAIVLGALAAAALLPWAGPLPLALVAGLLVVRTGAPVLRSPLVAAAALLLLASHLAAADPWSSLGTLAHWGLLLIAFAAGAALADLGAGRTLAAGLAVAGAAWSAHALWQVGVQHPRLLASGETLSALARAQLADGRGNGPFALPGHLGAMLAALVGLVLAEALAVRLAGRRRAAAVFALALLPLVAGFLAARSLAAAALLGAGLAVMALIASRGRLRRGIVLGAVAGAALVVALFAWTRFEGGERSNPAAGRARNWVAAARLVAERPVLGWGGGAFAHEYARVRPPGANETRHAHQALLEAAAEHGAVFALLLLAPALLLARRARRHAEQAPGAAERWSRAGPVAAAVVLLGHGLVDFGWSRPEWAVWAALLLGCACGGAAAAAAAARVDGRRRELAVLAAVAVLVVWVDRAERLEQGAIDRVRLLGAEGRHEAAAELARREAARRRGSSELPALEARARLAAGQRSGLAAPCDEAVARSPRRAPLHAVRARALQAEGRRLEAWLAAERAAALAPTVAEIVALRDALRPVEAAR